jgi:integrase
MSVRNPSPAVVVCQKGKQPFFEAKFRYRGTQVKRRIGRAWVHADERSGEWRRLPGRVPDGFYNERAAHVAAASIVAAYVAKHEQDGDEEERKVGAATFREVAVAYLHWLEHIKGARPSTLQSHRNVLAEPGVAHKRGEGTTNGYIMSALGDRPAAKVTTREVEDLLTAISETTTTRKIPKDAPPRKISPRTVNKYRAVIVAAYNYGCRPSTFGLPDNPAKDADKRREAEPGALVFYSPEDIEALARSLAAGKHRKPTTQSLDGEEHEARHAEDQQDAEIVRVAAYSGLRMGELRALRWRDVDFARHALTVERAISAGVESSTKSGKIRGVPLPDQAAGALNRLSKRDDFTDPNELVFCSRLGRVLDDSALRRRFKAGRDAEKLRRLRFHDLRHTYGSLLAAGGVDLVSIKNAMGHSSITTTERYLHARAATEQAKVFTRAFEPTPLPDETSGTVGAPGRLAA